MTFTLGIYEFIVNIVEAFLLYMYISIFFQSKIKSKNKITLILFFQAVVYQLVNIYTDAGSYYGLIILLIFNIVVYSYILNSNFIKLVLSIILYFILLCFDEIVVINIITIMFNVTPDVIFIGSIYRIIGTILSRIIVYFVLRFIMNMKIVHSNLRKIYIYELIVISVFNIFFMFMVFNVYKQKSFVEQNSIVVYIITLAIIIFTVSVIKLVEAIIKYSFREIEWNMKDREYKRQISSIIGMQELIYKLKAQRHDFNNHISCIYGLVRMNKIYELEGYIKEIVGDIQDINNIVNIDNPIIESILNLKLYLAKKKNIKIDIDVDIPKKLNIEPIDISVILGNALDNALDACDNLEDGFISVKIYMEKKHLIIKITNSKRECSLKKNNEYITTKNDRENHGFGLKNIEYVVNKYNGLLKIEESENKFLLNIALGGYSGKL